MYGEVKVAERLSPSMVRVVLSGGDLDGFTPTGFTDEYINAQFVPLGAPYEVPFERETIDAVDQALRPRPRRYTVRQWEQSTKELTIDFVAHGDQGYAGPWAQRARPGDRLQFKGPGGSYAPDPDAAWHLLVGDESALPAIAASLEVITPGKRCVALIVVDGEADELPLESPGALEVHWLHRRSADDPEALLADAVGELEFTDGPVDLFIHGEADEVRTVRRHLIVDRKIDIDGASISPYWRRSFTDEKWREVKRSWVAEMAADA